MNRIITLFFIAVLSLTTFAQHDFNPRQINFNVTADQWREDLRYFASELPKRHKNAFHFMTREQFENEVKQLNQTFQI